LKNYDIPNQYGGAARHRDRTERLGIVYSRGLALTDEISISDGAVDSPILRLHGDAQ
jgi:hypothetical protein